MLQFPFTRQYAANSVTHFPALLVRWSRESYIIETPKVPGQVAAALIQICETLRKRYRRLLRPKTIVIVAGRVFVIEIFDEESHEALNFVSESSWITQ